MPFAARCLCVVLALLVGCGQEPRDNALGQTDRPAATERDGRPASSSATAADYDRAAPLVLLQAVLDRYGQSATVRGDFRLALRYRAQGQPREEIHQLAIRMQRPNRIRLEIQQEENRIAITSDGHQLTAQVLDPLTEDLRGQVVVRPAPATIGVASLYAASEVLDPAVPQQLVSLLLSLPIHLDVSPLGLLNRDGPFAQQLLAAELKELAPVLIEQRPHRVLQVSASSGRFVITVDPATLQIRRIAYPTDALFQHLPSQQQPTDVQLVLETLRVELDGAVSEDQWRTPPLDETTGVQYFVLPPVGLPTSRYGQPSWPLALEWLDSPAASVASDPPVRVLTWFDSHASSREALERLERARRTLMAEKSSVEFAAVAVDARTTTTDQQLRDRLRAWEITLPIARDLSAVGRDRLEITQAPTTIIVDGRGRLQMFEVGANPQLDELVTYIVRQLRQGVDVAAEIRTQYQREEDRYLQQLAIARTGRPDAGRENSQWIPSPSKLQHLRMVEAWRSERLAAPGNLIAVPATDDTEATLLVLDQMRRVVQFDLSGQVQRDYELPLEEAAFFARLRHTRDARGRDYFLAFSQLGRFVDVYDQQFRRVLRYPGPRQQHTGIMDARLVDLDADGTLELCIGFAAPHGCHAVDLQGRRLWSSRELPGVLSLTVHPRLRPSLLLATGDDGRLLPIVGSGKPRPVTAVANRAVHQLFSSTSPAARPTELLGMAYTIDGSLLAVGLDGNLGEQWSYGLPGGEYRHQIELAQSTQLFATPNWFWLLAGPDGSVHLVRDDGALFDRFHTGGHLAGLAGHAIGGHGRLYTVTDGQVTAYDLQEPPQDAARP